LGGKATVAKHGVVHMQSIGRKSWLELVRRFGGDRMAAGAWLNANGKGARLTVDEFQVYAGRTPVYDAVIPFWVEDRYAAARARAERPLPQALEDLEL
jgi:hypothetical protein